MLGRKILVLNAILTFCENVKKKEFRVNPCLMEKGDSLPDGLLSAYSAAKMCWVAVL